MLPRLLPGRNKRQTDMIGAKSGADAIDLILRRALNDAADEVLDTLDGVLIRVVAALEVVAELPAVAEGAAALLGLAGFDGADVVVGEGAAGVVDEEVDVVRVAVVLEEVVTAGFGAGVEVAEVGAAVAHGAVEGVGERGRGDEEEGEEGGELDARAEGEHLGWILRG